MGEFKASRRRVLQGLGASAAFAAASGRLGTAWADQAMRRAAGVLAPGSRPDLTKPVGTDLIPQVEHIVIYMQENRSFDHYFGMLGRGDGFTLAGGVPTNSNPDANKNPVVVTHSNAYCEDGHGASQSWNASHISYDGGAMDGFITAAGGGTGSMTYFTGDDLPFYYSLANTFPICDRWFCSVLGQTFPNRRYLQAATSLGIVSTDIAEVTATPDAPNGLIWDRLTDAGVTWKDYAVDLADIMLFPNFFKANTDKIFNFNDFLTDCANGTLPQVSIVSPGGTQWSEESPNDIQLGEAYSSSIINAVMHGPLWPKTAMFFTYDEHGGYYDHVPPPPAIAPDSIAPRITVPPDQPGAFDRYGMRVPGFVISPFAKANYVSSVVHDHTSVLKFVETKWNLEAMTYRDANADDLLDCFDFDAVAFREPPTLAAPGVPSTGSTCSAVALPPTEPVAVPPSTTTSTSTNVVSTTTLLNMAATLPATEPTQPRFGSKTGDGVPTELAKTGSPLDRLATAGGLAALGGLAVVLAAQEKARRAADTPNTTDA
jgi:phospholipase C